MSKPITHAEFAAQLAAFRHHTNPAKRKLFCYGRTYLWCKHPFAGGINSEWQGPYQSPDEEAAQRQASERLRELECRVHGTVWDVSDKAEADSLGTIMDLAQTLPDDDISLLILVSAHYHHRRITGALSLRKAGFLIFTNKNAEIMFKLAMP